MLPNALSRNDLQKAKLDTIKYNKDCKLTTNDMISIIDILIENWDEIDRLKKENSLLKIGIKL